VADITEATVTSYVARRQEQGAANGTIPSVGEARARSSRSSVIIWTSRLARCAWIPAQRRTTTAAWSTSPASSSRYWRPSSAAWTRSRNDSAGSSRTCSPTSVERSARGRRGRRSTRPGGPPAARPTCRGC
jgi:hypothetical protein